MCIQLNHCNHPYPNKKTHSNSSSKDWYLLLFCSRNSQYTCKCLMCVFLSLFRLLLISHFSFSHHILTHSTPLHTTPLHTTPHHTTPHHTTPHHSTPHHSTPCTGAHSDVHYDTRMDWEKNKNKSDFNVLGEKMAIFVWSVVGWCFSPQEYKSNGFKNSWKWYYVNRTFIFWKKNCKILSSTRVFFGADSCRENNQQDSWCQLKILWLQFSLLLTGPDFFIELNWIELNGTNVSEKEVGLVKPFRIFSFVVKSKKMLSFTNTHKRGGGLLSWRAFVVVSVVLKFYIQSIGFFSRHQRIAQACAMMNPCMRQPYFSLQSKW